jgi:hypothetical protein
MDRKVRPVVLFPLFVTTAFAFCYWPRIFADWDEHTTLYGASRVIEGGLLFVDFVETKFPLAQWLFIPSVLGGSIEIHRVIQSLVIAFTALLLYSGLRGIKVNQWFSILLAALFILLSRSLDEGGAHSVFYLEHFSNLFLVSAFLLWIKTLENGGRLQGWFWTLCLLSCVACSRPNLVIPVILLLSLILARWLIGFLAGYKRRDLTKKIVVATLGAAMPFLLMALPYLVVGEITAYWFGITELLPKFSSVYSANAGTNQEVIYRIIRDISETAGTSSKFSDTQGVHYTYQSIYFALCFVFLINMAVISVHFFARYRVVGSPKEIKMATPALVLFSIMIYVVGLVLSLAIRGMWVHNILMFLPPMIVLLAYVTTSPWNYSEVHSFRDVHPTKRRRRPLLLLLLIVPIIVGVAPLVTHWERQPSQVGVERGLFFYNTENNQKFSDRKVYFDTARDGRFHEYKLPLSNEPLKKIRVDPVGSGKRTREIEISSIVVADSDGKTLASFTLGEPNWTFNNFDSISFENDNWLGRPQSIDPYLISPEIDVEGASEIRIMMRIQGIDYSFLSWFYYQWLIP